jgi:hypothetical protein
MDRPPPEQLEIWRDEADEIGLPAVLTFTAVCLIAGVLAIVGLASWLA